MGTINKFANLYDDKGKILEKAPIKTKYIWSRVFKYFSLKNLNKRYNPNKTALPKTGNIQASFWFIVSIPSFSLSPEISHIFVEKVQPTYTNKHVDTAVIIEGWMGTKGLINVIRSKDIIAI